MDLGVDHSVAASPPAFGADAERAPAVDSDSDSEDLGPETAVDEADPARTRSPRDPHPPHSPLHIQPKAEQTQIDGALLDNVGESGEDSEDEWNYYKGEGEQEEQHQAEEPDEPPLSETPCQDTSAWESSSVDMNSSPLNPDAPVFVPGTAGDVLLAESPRKPLPVDDLPDVHQFSAEATVRPAELLDLDKCDQLNGHHNDSVHMTNMEHLNGNKCDMDSLGFGFNVKSEKDKDGTLIETFERIQKDTTDFCNIQVFQAQNDINPFADNEEILERLKSKESDPMSMSFYQEKDDDTCERLVNKDPQEILNSVQPLPESDDDDDIQYNGSSNENDANKENMIPGQLAPEISNSPSIMDRLETDNNLYNNRTELVENDNDNVQRDNTDDYEVERRTTYDSVLDFGSSSVPHETIPQTDTPESHKLLFEQIPEIPDGKTSEVEFINVEDPSENMTQMRPISPRNEILDRDFESNHNKTENLNDDNITSDHVTGVSEAQIEQAETKIDSNIDPLLITDSESENPRDEIGAFENSLTSATTEDILDIKNEVAPANDDFIDIKSNETQEIEFSSSEAFAKDFTDFTNPAAFSSSINLEQSEPDSTISVEIHQRQFDTELVEVPKEQVLTTIESCTYEKEEVLESHSSNVEHQESLLISSSCVSPIPKEVKHPEEIVNIESATENEYEDINIHSESHVVTSSINDHVLNDPLASTQESHLLDESGDKTNLTSQFEGLSLNSPENQTDLDIKSEPVAETFEAPDIVPEATNDLLVTDVDIGVSESRAQEICVPMTNEIPQQEIVSAEIESKTAELARPPTLDIPLISGTSLAAGAVATAAIATAPAVAKTAAETAKTPTSTKAAKPTATTPRTPVSAVKKTATPTTKTPTSLAKTTPAKTPTSANKIPLTKTPVSKTAPTKEPVKAAASPRAAPSKTAQPLSKPSPVASKTSITSKAAAANKPPTATSKHAAAASKPITAVSKPASATSKPASTTSKPLAATKPAATGKVTSSTSKPAATSKVTAASKPTPTAIKPSATAKPAARSLPATITRAPLSARPKVEVGQGDKKPMTNGDAKVPPKKPIVQRAAPSRPAPRPTTAPAKSVSARAPLDKTGKELANKKATTKAPTTAKSAPANGVAKNTDANKSNGIEALRGGVTKRSPSPPAADAQLPDVIA